MNKILIVSLCKQPLGELEFVRPIEDILKKNNVLFFTKKFDNVKEEDLKKCSAVILSGTSLADFEYLKSLDKFNWLKNFEKPVLGICAGMQVLYLVLEGKEKDFVNAEEIGSLKVNFEKKFFGLKGEVQVYSLHKLSLKKVKNFEVFAKMENSIQAMKLKNKDIFGVMFHPEVLNKEMLLNFCKYGK